MKLKAASGHACYGTDLHETAAFCEKLGLQIKERRLNRLIGYLNWYRIDFFCDAEDVDTAYREVLASVLKPIGEPKDQPWGNREFTICEPDGYKPILFKRKVAKNLTD